MKIIGNDITMTQTHSKQDVDYEREEDTEEIKATLSGNILTLTVMIEGEGEHQMGVLTRQQ